MDYSVREIVDLDEILHLLALCLGEYDAHTRIAKRGLSPLQYFQYQDERARAKGYTPFYVALCAESDYDPGDSKRPAKCSPIGGATPVGFARCVIEDEIPGYRALPGDRPVMCIDEIYLLRPYRGRGGFAVLVDRLRNLALTRYDTGMVYARVVNRLFSRTLQGYGFGAMPLLFGTLTRLTLPAVGGNA